VLNVPLIYLFITHTRHALLAAQKRALCCCCQVLDSEFTDENRQKCAEAARPLLQAVDVLAAFAMSSEFASVPAKISDKARLAQQPITNAGRELIDGACNMVLAAKQLAMNPRDPPIYHTYSSHSHSVSEAIKRLVAAVR